MRTWLTVALAVAALIATACSGASVEWRDEPAVGEWPLGFRFTADELAEYLVDQHELVLAERVWCRANAGLLPDGGPGSIFGEDASERDQRRFFDPLGDAEMAWITDLATVTAQLRELPLDPLPEFRIISHDDLRIVACHALLHEDQRANEGGFWLFERALGVNHQDWTPSVLNALWAYSVGGWYSFDTKVVTLVGDTPLASHQFYTITHELVHAMQDQYLEGGIEALREDVTSDHASAISWIIEGDASTVEAVIYSAGVLALLRTYDWGEDGGWLPERNGLSLGIAPLIGQEFFAPYISGADYVREQQNAGGWARVNALLADPPQSSEQILHPDKLESREPPIDAERLAELRRQVFDPREEPSATTMGEQYLVNLIGLSTPALAAEAAAGWGGDELAVWSIVNGRRSTTAIWLIAFDNAKEHREGVNGLREWLIGWSNSSAVTDSSGRALAYDGAAGAIRIVDSAQTAWLIVSTDRRTADKITRDALLLTEEPGWWN